MLVVQPLGARRVAGLVGRCPGAVAGRGGTELVDRVYDVGSGRKRWKQELLERDSGQNGA